MNLGDRNKEVSVRLHKESNMAFADFKINRITYLQSHQPRFGDGKKRESGNEVAKPWATICHVMQYRVDICESHLTEISHTHSLPLKNTVRPSQLV